MEITFFLTIMEQLEVFQSNACNANFPQVKHLYVFQRTPCWTARRDDFSFPRWMMTLFKVYPPLMYMLRLVYYWRNEFLYVLGTSALCKWDFTYFQFLKWWMKLICTEKYFFYFRWQLHYIKREKPPIEVFWNYIFSLNRPIKLGMKMRKLKLNGQIKSLSCDKPWLENK